MANGSTAHSGFILPEVGSDTAQWGTHTNANWTQLDSYLFGLTNPANLTVNSTPGSAIPGTLTFQNGSATTKPRWALVEDTIAEGGGDAGSNLSLQAYHDGGGLAFTPLSFTRSTGGASFGGTLNVTGAATFASSLAVTGALTSTGVTDGSNATAGQVGEYKSSTVAVGSAVGLGSGTAGNIASLVSLPPGDWDVAGVVQFTSTGSPTGVSLFGACSTTSGTLTSIFAGSPFLPTGTGAVTTPRVRVSISVATTVFLVAEAIFTGGTISGYGFISARRAR